MLTLGAHRRLQCEPQLAACGGEVIPHLGADIPEHLQHETHGTTAALAAGLVRDVGHWFSLTATAGRQGR